MAQTYGVVEVELVVVEVDDELLVVELELEELVVVEVDELVVDVVL